MTPRRAIAALAAAAFLTMGGVAAASFATNDGAQPAALSTMEQAHYGYRDPQ